MAEIETIGDVAGQEVQAVTLRGGGLTARILTLGAVLHDLRLEGVAHGLTPAPDLADLGGPFDYAGAIVGPVANRIAGAQVEIEGRIYLMEPNEGGKTALHSGAQGLHARIWRVEEASSDALVLAVDLADGDCGLPGNRAVRAEFSLADPGVLRLRITATTDAATLMNPAQHSYWNLDGSDHWRGHALRIAADRWCPTDADSIPTGVASVDGTGHDLRAGRVLVPGEPFIDHNFCLSDGPVPLRGVAWLSGASGITMAIATTAPGLQVYDGSFTARRGRETYECIAMEPQCWPDAPGRGDFPSILLRPGEVFEQVSEWRFSRG